MARRSKADGLVLAARRSDRGARQRVVTAHLGLIRAIASRYRDMGLPLDDLMQEGALGLLDAIERYDPRRNGDFETFARFRIRRALRDALTDKARLIRLPKGVVEQRRAAARAESRLLAATGTEPRPADIAAEMGLARDRVESARAAAFAALSLDERIGRDGARLESFLVDPTAPDPEAETLARERARFVRRALTRLPQRKREVVSRHFGIGRPPATIPQIAAAMHVSERRARTLERDALYELRDLYDVESARGAADGAEM